MTSTAIYLDGLLVEERHRLYDRGFTVRNHAGSSYKVGGTNTTSSIAALFTVVDVPVSLLPSVALNMGGLADWIGAMQHADMASLEEGLLDIECSVRVHRMPGILESTLLEFMPQARRYLAELSVVPVRALGDEEFVHLRESFMSHVASMVESAPVLADVSSRILGLFGGRDAFDQVARWCYSVDDRVSVPAALALRALEFDYQSYVSATPSIARIAVAELSNLIRTSPSEETRVYLAEDLGYLSPGEPSVLSALTDAALSDDVMDVRWAATVSLGRARSAGDALATLTALIADPLTPVRVVRASLVSLGRLLHRAGLDVTGVELASVDITELVDALFALLSSPDETTVAYSLFALGEVEALDVRVVSELVDFLSEDRPYVVVAHALLALYKVEARGSLSRDLALQVGARLPPLIRMQFDDGHPGSSYHEWFVVSAWRFLTMLEMSGDAARVAREAARLLDSEPSRSQYFEALASLQIGEYLLERDSDSRAARTAFEEAASRFNRVAQRKAFEHGALSDASALSAVTRAMWAKSRSEFLAAVAGIDSALFDDQGVVSAVQPDLLKVRDQITSIIDSRPSAVADAFAIVPVVMQRSRSSEACLIWFRLAVGFAAEVEKLRREVGGASDSRALLRHIGLMRSTLVRMRRQVEQSGSDRLASAQGGLERALEGVSGLPLGMTDAELFERAGDCVMFCVEALSVPLPVPDIDHQLQGAGRARLKVFRSGGATTRYDHELGGRIEVIVGDVLLLRAVVEVDLVAGDEILVLSWLLESDLMQSTVIRVHEGMESIEFTLPDIGRDLSSLRVTVRLSLLTAGYSEAIATRELVVEWLKASELEGGQGVEELGRLSGERVLAVEDLTRYLSSGGQSARSALGRESQVARLDSVMDSVVQALAASGQHIEVRLQKAPFRQRNGVFVAVRTEDLPFIEVLVRRVESGSRQSLARGEVVNQVGNQVDLLLPSLTFDAIDQFLIGLE